MALAVGAAAVTYDLSDPYGWGHYRFVLGAAAMAVLLWLARGDLGAIGFTRPQPSGRWWIKATLITGAIFVAIVTLVLVVLVATGHATSPPMFHSPAEFAWRACVIAPLKEEPIYRVALCAPLVAVVGRWPTIVISGLVFACLHHVYGNLSPDNALAGILLGWAYLRSGSVLVPIALHAIGNGLVVLFVVYLAPYVYR
jgi:uncharacterized protein